MTNGIVPDCLAKTMRVFLAESVARYLLQCAQDSSVVAMDESCLIEFVGNVTPVVIGRPWAAICFEFSRVFI